MTKTDENGEEITKIISYILQLTENERFMADLLSNLVNNLSERIHKTKCNYAQDDKKCKICGITYKVCNCFVEYINFIDDLTKYKYFLVTKIINKSLKKLKELLFNAYKFTNHDNKSLFHCCEKVFILINIWMIGNNSMKYHYLRKKIFTVT